MLMDSLFVFWGCVFWGEPEGSWEWNKMLKMEVEAMN